MYVLAIDGKVKQFPYSEVDLRKDNPNTSFPDSLDTDALAEWGVFPVEATPQPEFDEATQDCRAVFPELALGSWKQKWEVTQASPEEVQRRLADKTFQVRNERNGLLSASDWTQLADSPADAIAWKTYRQALRDVPSQPGFPWDITWPEEPA